MLTVTTLVIQEGPRNLIMQFTGVGDGSGNETNVVKVDVSTLRPPAYTVRIRKISGTVEFGIVQVWWDALVPVKALELSGDINLDFERCGGLLNNAGGGKTGDILFKTIGFELNSTYNLLFEMIKK